MPVLVEQSEVVFSPGPFDVHTHPRVFDALTADNFLPEDQGSEGKAGLRVYTEVALKSGIVGMLAMPNEARRLYLPGSSENTELLQYPIATADRLDAMQSAVSHEAVIPTGLIFGLDPEKAITGLQQKRVNRNHLFHEFTAVKDECLALKIYGAETTGGNNVDKRFIPEVAQLWYGISPEKPIIMHLEDGDVAEVLQSVARLPNGKDIPLHIAHVSSKEELQAVIAAKEGGMNVTCEVTPHHLAFDESLRDEIGMFGCMKPSLKSIEDVEFIWENIRHVDIFASDCAPHREFDKLDANKTTYGVTNHTVMLPTLLAAVEEGKLSYDDIDQKFCVSPRKRFNLPIVDGSRVEIKLEPTGARQLESASGYAYGENPWLRTEQGVFLIGKVAFAAAGKSLYKADFVKGTSNIQPSYTHLIRPRNLRS